MHLAICHLIVISFLSFDRLGAFLPVADKTLSKLGSLNFLFKRIWGLWNLLRRESHTVWLVAEVIQVVNFLDCASLVCTFFEWGIRFVRAARFHSFWLGRSMQLSTCLLCLLRNGTTWDACSFLQRHLGKLGPKRLELFLWSYNWLGLFTRSFVGESINRWRSCVVLVIWLLLFKIIIVSGFSRNHVDKTRLVLVIWYWLEVRPARTRIAWILLVDLGHVCCWWHSLLSQTCCSALFVLFDWS